MATQVDMGTWALSSDRAVELYRLMSKVHHSVVARASRSKFSSTGV